MHAFLHEKNGYLKMVHFLLFIFYCSLVTSFNLAPESKILISGNIDQREHHFGFTVSLQKVNEVNSHRFRVIIGAPKTPTPHSHVKNAGAVYQCNLFNGVLQKCFRVVLDQYDEPYRESYEGHSYVQFKENASIGLALSINEDNGLAIVCGPGWKNQFHAGYYLMNGACYVLPNIIEDDGGSSVQKLLPLISKENQGYKVVDDSTNQTADFFYYSYGEAGFSVESTDNDLILGAPGVFNWKGTVIRYHSVDSFGGSSFFGNAFVPNPYFTDEIPLAGYLGYAVASGRFTKGSEKLFVASAPRANMYHGKVFIFQFPRNTEEPLDIKIRLEGLQTGEYFGASLCVVDLNEDGVDDILVGAPQHSQNRSSDSGDEGKVYVFLNDGNGYLENLDLDITGSKIQGSRFGIAISMIGDLNLDGYPDVAIGAPYERHDRSTGSIYIYSGNENGISKNFVQRIKASEIFGGLRGFGISISRGLDVDGNNYNDVVVGAYESGHAVVIKSRPIIRFFPRVSTNVAFIEQNLTYFELTVCLSYDSPFASGKVDTDVSISVDKHKRAHFRGRKNTLKYILTLVKGVERCETNVVYLEPYENWPSHILFSPIPILLTYNVVQQNVTEFCKFCPVIDPTTDSHYLTQLPILSQCANSVCVPVWIISAEFPHLELPFVIGSKNSTVLRIHVSNRGDSSTIKHVLASLPHDIQLKMVPSKCGRETKNIWQCLPNAIFHSNKKESLDLVLDLAKLEMNTQTKQFNLSLISYDYESGNESLSQNYTINLPLKANIKIEVSAKANPNIYVETSEDNKYLPVTHSYHIYNSGFTNAKNVDLEFFLPKYLISGSEKNLTIESHQLKGFLNSKPVVCGMSDLPLKKSELIKERTIDDDVLFLGCENSKVKCISYKCSVELLTSKSDEINVDIKMSISIQTLKPLFRKFFHIYLNSSVEVQSDYSKEKIDKTAATRFDAAAIPEKADPWFWWYIAIAVICAVLLLALIVFFLYKCKFFQRLRDGQPDERGMLVDKNATVEPEEDAQS